MTPIVEKTENSDLNELLTEAGYTEQVAVLKVEGVTFTDPGMIVYEPEFSFLRGGTCTMYKYIPDIQKFVPGPTVMYDGYDRNFMDVENLPSADGEVNGTYVVVTQPLPEELVITTEEIQPLREQLELENTQSLNKSESQSQNDDVQIEENIESQGNENEVVVSDKDKKLEWSFADGMIPENFTSEAKIEVTSGKDVKVDFAYSGKLPKGTMVKI